jgi:hypothetical protein
VRLCEGSFAENRYFSRATPIGSICFIQHCIWMDRWPEFYGTLSKKTRAEVSYLKFWIGIDFVYYPGTDRKLIDLLKNAEVWGIEKKSHTDDFAKVVLNYKDVGGRLWLVNEDGRWRFALKEMQDHYMKKGK